MVEKLKREREMEREMERVSQIHLNLRAARILFNLMIRCLHSGLCLTRLVF